VKRIPAAAAIFALAGALAALSAVPAGPTTDLQRLARLYEDSRYFELRDALAPLRDDPAPDLEFFRGTVDQVFNRLEPAVSRLRRFLAAAEKGPVRMLTKEAGVLLADAYLRLGRYREAAVALRGVLARFGPILDEEERANLEKQAGLLAALAGVPPQKVEIPADTAIRMTDRHFPVQVGRRTFFAGYDTGANLSVLYESMAAELGVPLYGPAIRVQTGTGGWVEGRTGVLAEMRLGPIVFRNVVVLVLPDRFFRSAKARSGVDRRGLLGAPVLEALREFTETAAGEFLVPARPRPREGENMCFSGFMPVIEAVHRGARIRLCLDTGAAATVLYLPFYRRHRGEINARARPREITVGGIGDSRRVTVRVLDEFDFRAGGKDLAMRRVLVQTEATHADTRYFHGTLGNDLLSHCSRMTLNFVSMSFILE
jgi:hypothetical protein